MSTNNGLAQTPPMGWNSWDCYAGSVCEHEVRAQADVMASKLKPFGWEYIVIDGGWYYPIRRKGEPHGPAALDAHGRLIPASDKYPSSRDGAGFKPLADYIHSKGLKFGIHIMRGMPRPAHAANAPILGTNVRTQDVTNTADTCSWSTSNYGLDHTKRGAQEYYHSIMNLYAQWGVDFIKCDDISSPYRTAEIEAVRRAIDQAGRPMLLSLSPGNVMSLPHAQHAADHSEMWRITSDVWDTWYKERRWFGNLRDILNEIRLWAPYAGAGHWPDADMIPLGRLGPRPAEGEDRMTNLTRDEQVTFMTILAVTRAPMMFGGDLPSLDDWTLSMLTNPEVLRAHRATTDNKEIYRQMDLVLWTAKATDGDARYLAAFNLADTVARPTLKFDELFMKGAYVATELWTGKGSQASETISLYLRPHASAVYRLEAGTGGTSGSS